MQTFKQFVKENRKGYIVPVGLTVSVFAVSPLMTNIGWYAIPVCIASVAIIVALETFSLYQQWHRIESIMRDIKANSIKRS